MLDDFTRVENALFERVVITSPLIVSSTASVSDTIAQMYRAKSSYAVVVEQPIVSPVPKQRLVGVFTERDLVRAAALEQPFDELTIASVISTQAPTVSKKDITSVLDLFPRMRQHDVCALPVVCNHDQLAGVVTQESILQALDSENGQPILTSLKGIEAAYHELEKNHSELEKNHSELEKSHSALSRTNQELSETNKELKATLKELQRTKQELQQDNVELESTVKHRTSDLLIAEGRWRSLLEEVHLVVIGLDLEGRVNYANPFFLRLTGYSAEETLNKYWFETFIPREEREHTYQYFQTFVDDREFPLRYQNAILTRAGSLRTIAWHNVVLRNHTNRVIGTMSIGEDITDRLVVDRMKGEFVSVVSHELRTPLTAIHGGLNLITSGLVTSESSKGRELLQVAAINSLRLVRLVNDILELERLESGKAQINKEKVVSQALTSQVVHSFEAVANSRGITIDSCDPGLVLMADCDRIIQVLTNLLDNAIKFSPKNTTIELSVERWRASAMAEPTALFKVKDEGRGIPSEDLAEIFERFTQVNYADSREMGGTGLGLAICHNIVYQHGGKIWVESRLGEGSCFFFTVPLFTQ